MKTEKYLAIDVTTLVKWNRSPVGIIRTQLEFVNYTLQNDLTALYFKFNDAKNELIQLNNSDVREIVLDLLQDRYTTKTVKSTSKKRTSKTNIFSKIHRVYKSGGIKEVLIRICKKICPSTLKTFAKRVYIRLFVDPKSDSDTHISNSINDKLFSPEIYQTQYIEPKFLTRNCTVVSIGLDWDYSNYPLLYWLKKKIGFEFVSAFYDAIPITHPDYVQSINFSRYFFSHIYYLAYLSDRVFCISKYSKQELNKILQKHNIKKDITLKTIYLGDSISDKKPPLKIKTEIKHKDNYLLYVSTIEARKNHKLLLQVWQKLSKEHIENLPDLVFVGMMGWGIEDLQSIYNADKNLQKIVHFYHNIDDKELSYLYANAKFTLFPSFVEGWGLGAVESMIYEKPCIISDAPALIEATQGLMPSLDPNDISAWATMIKTLIEDESKLEELKLKIRDNFSTRRWDEFSRDFLSFAKVKS